MQKLFYFSFILMLALFSCKKESTPAPGPPVISFGSFTTTNGINGVITFNFTDPDGDIGLHQEDTTGSYSKTGVGYYDFYMRYYYKNYLGNFVTYYHQFNTTPNPLSDSLIFGYRIPFVTNNIKSKTLDGQIIVNLNGYKPYFNYNDSISDFRFEFWIYDRALHKSNVVTTPEFHTPY